jgi:hypothetical protein
MSYISVIWYSYSEVKGIKRKEQSFIPKWDRQGRNSGRARRASCSRPYGCENSHLGETWTQHGQNKSSLIVLLLTVEHDELLR